MSFQSQNVTELKAEEQRCLSKLDKKRKSLQVNDPTLSFGAAYARAMQALPNTYAAYNSARRELSALGVLPIPAAGE